MDKGSPGDIKRDQRVGIHEQPVKPELRYPHGDRSFVQTHWLIRH